MDKKTNVHNELFCHIHPLPRFILRQQKRNVFPTHKDHPQAATTVPGHRPPLPETLQCGIAP
jgi:hypothetical protein